MTGLFFSWFLLHVHLHAYNKTMHGKEKVRNGTLQVQPDFYLAVSERYFVVAWHPMICEFVLQRTE